MNIYEEKLKEIIKNISPEDMKKLEKGEQIHYLKEQGVFYHIKQKAFSLTSPIDVINHEETDLDKLIDLSHDLIEEKDFKKKVGKKFFSRPYFK